MKTVGFRSIVLYLLLFAFLGGTGYLVVNLFLHGNQWAMQPYNGHIYAESSTVKMGDIKDRNGNLLATTEDGRRLYSESETVRRALMLSLIHISARGNSSASNLRWMQFWAWRTSTGP